VEDAERTILEVDGKFGSTTCNTLVGSDFKDADDTLTRLNPTFKEDSTEDVDERENALDSISPMSQKAVVFWEMFALFK
jgi:hypothetical protein